MKKQYTWFSRGLVCAFKSVLVISVPTKVDDKGVWKRLRNTLIGPMYDVFRPEYVSCLWLYGPIKDEMLLHEKFPDSYASLRKL